MSGTKSALYPLVAACVLLALACEAEKERSGADRARTGQQSEAQTEGMSVHDAISIALETLKARDYMYEEEFDLTVRRGEARWFFWFVFKPRTPGKDVTVLVDDDGTVEIMLGI